MAVRIIPMTANLTLRSDSMNLHAPEQDDRDADSPAIARAPRGAGPKFTYASGATPLAGYTIKRGVGQGGFGEVYYAVSDGGKEVALKLIRRSLDVELRGVAHCLNLKHPHLLDLYDIRTDEHDDHWVVMEFVTGDCLEDVIADHPEGMPAAEAIAWMHGVAAGVGYLHECGIVHRDLKPGNIFSDQGLVKVGDYGLSKFISCSRRSGQTESVGTVHYMAPEIANGRYGKEIDVYALGVMLYEMLTGQVPFEGESVGEVLMKHLTAEPDLSGLNEPYRSIVGKALAKDPATRYATAEELIAALPSVDAANSRVHASPRVAPRPQPVVEAEAVTPAAVHGATGPRIQPDAVAAASTGAAPNATAASGGESFGPREPVAEFVADTFGQLSNAWNNHINTPAKVLLIVGGLWLLPAIGGLLVTALIFFGVIYLVYRVLWTIANWIISPVHAAANHKPDAPIQAQAVSEKNPEAAAKSDSRPHISPQRARRSRRKWNKKTVPVLPARTKRERFTELLGSMALGAVVCLVMPLVLSLLLGNSATDQTVWLDRYAWVAVVSIAGTWSVLAATKFWEGRTGEPALRRFWMLVIGLGLGVVAYGTQQGLLVQLPHMFEVEPFFVDQPTGSGEHYPLLSYLTYFGFLMLMVRWWRLADPLRGSRLSMWTTAVCVTVAIALYQLWPFQQDWGVLAQPWGFMAAATIAIATQLSSPWYDPKQLATAPADV